MTRKMSRNVGYCKDGTVSFISAECFPEKFISQPGEFSDNTPFILRHKHNLTKIIPTIVQ